MTNPHKLIFGQKKKLNLTSREIGKKTGINFQIIDNYENDENYKITFDSVMKICKPLGIELKVVK